MSEKINVSNPRFELADSVLKNYKEVEVIFNYKGKDYKYFVFVKEGKKVNYIKEAKKQFENDLKSGKALKTIKASTANHSLLIASTSILGVATLALTGLFTWKIITNSNPEPEPTPTETDCIVTFETNGGDRHIDTMKVKPGTIITEPTVAKTNYTFDGWYEEKDLSGEKFNFDTAINKDYTFYAKWTGGPEPVPTLCTLTVNAGEDGIFPNGTTSISLKVKSGSNILEDLLVLDEPIYKGDKLYQTFDTFTYEGGEPIEKDDTVTSDGIVLVGAYHNKPLDECPWKVISEISAKGAAYAEEFFGPLFEIVREEDIVQVIRHSIEKTVMVNGQPHQVRIIGYGQDKDENGKEIGITFEFANLISDANGYSLATQWNDADYTVANHNYLDSSLRMALVGEKQDKGHILWAQKGETAWTTDSRYQNKCVLDMLPSELVSVLKTPSKYINIYNSTLETPTWEEKTVEDKLFLLSPKEMGGGGGEELTSTYAYYTSAQSCDRVKKQIKNEPYAPEPIPKINDPAAGQVCIDDVYNMAGWNSSIDPTDCGYAWLRSPRTDYYYYALITSDSGSISFANTCYYACSVAPAFCV